MEDVDDQHILTFNTSMDVLQDNEHFILFIDVDTPP